MAIQLRQNEEIISEAHFHWTAQIWSGVWAAFMSISIIGQAAGPKPSTGTLFFTFCLGYVPFFYAIIKNKTKCYVVTNQRLYVENGILSKSKTDIPLNKINDISFDQSFFQRIFGSGNLSIMTGNSKPTKLEHIADPEVFREKLSQFSNSKVAA